MVATSKAIPCELDHTNSKKQRIQSGEETEKGYALRCIRNTALTSSHLVL